MDEIILDKHTDDNSMNFAGKKVIIFLQKIQQFYGFDNLKILEGRIKEERQKQEALYRRLCVMESEKSKLLLLLE